MRLGLILAALFAAGLAFGKSAESIRVDPISDTIKRVFVESRAYIVFRFPNGTYTVLLERNPTVNITFNQTAELMRNGDSTSLKQLEADMKRFPKNLFESPLVE